MAAKTLDDGIDGRPEAARPRVGMDALSGQNGRFRSCSGGRKTRLEKADSMNHFVPLLSILSMRRHEKGKLGNDLKKMYGYNHPRR